MGTPAPQGEGSRWERWAGVGGILFVAALLVLFFVSGEPPEDPTTEELLAFYTENEVETTWIPFAAIIVGALGFVWFLGSVGSILRRAEGGTGRVAWIAATAGAGSLILLLGAAGVFISLAFNATDPGNPNFQFDVSTHTMVEGAGFGLFVFHVILGAAFVAAASAVFIRTRVLPRWFGWVGVVLALPMVAFPATFFIGLFAYWLWILIAAIFILLGRGLRPAPTA